MSISFETNFQENFPTSQNPFLFPARENSPLLAIQNSITQRKQIYSNFVKVFDCSTNKIFPKEIRNEICHEFLSNFDVINGFSNNAQNLLKGHITHNI